MTAFKKLNRKDSYITVYNSKKNWNVSQKDFDNLGIKIYKPNSSPPYLQDSIKHLYYSQLEANSNTSGSYENYYQSSFDNLNTRLRELKQNNIVISLSSKVVGINIEPGSFKLQLNPNNIVTKYVSSGYIEQDLYNTDAEVYVKKDSNQYNINDLIPEQQETDQLGVGFEVVLPPPTQLDILTLKDDKEGNIRVVNQNGQSRPIGNIIYSHGIITIHNIQAILAIQNEEYFNLQWKSNLPIYTKNYHCTVKSSEFNNSQNKTTYDRQTGEIKDNLKTDSFSPYITTIGLYNNYNELVAVAKTSQPIPKSKNTDTAFHIKLDTVFGQDRSIKAKTLPNQTLYFTFANYLYRGGRQQGRLTRDEGGFKLYQKSSLNDKILSRNQTQGLVLSNLKGNRFYCYVDVIATGNQQTGYQYSVLYGENININNVRPSSFFTDILDNYLI